MAGVRILSACLMFLVAYSAQAADWPQFLGPKRDGSSEETGLARSWPGGSPKVLWGRDVGSGWSGVAVAGERIVLFHRIDNQEVVEGLDRQTGQQKWKQSYKTNYRDDFGFDNGPRATPVIADGRVFTLGADGDLTAWEVKDGKQLWQRNVNADYKVRKAFFGVGSSPMIAAGKLLVNVGGKGAGVVAFDPSNGQELWKTSDDAVSYSSPILAKIGGEELAAFLTREGLLALSPEKGEVRYTYPWRPRNPNSVSAASPIVVGDEIFLSVSYDTGALLLHAEKGELKEIWKNDESLSAHYNTPIYDKGHLYGIHGRQEYGAMLRCIEWSVGKVRWTKEGFGCATILKADGMAIALSEDGDLVLFEPSPDSYKELARASLLTKPCRAHIALADGRLYARDGKRLICVELKK